jgi:hypothetical protein
MEGMAQPDSTVVEVEVAAHLQEQVRMEMMVQIKPEVPPRQVVELVVMASQVQVMKGMGLLQRKSEEEEEEP